MNRCLPVLAIAFALAFPLAFPLAAEARGKTYGDGVKLAVSTPIGTLVASPSAWVGKKVRADGIVTDVCSKAGCWMELADEKTGKNIRFKVEDGVIVFPLTARGRKASAEGVFERLVESPEEQRKHQKEHKANHAHADHDSHSDGASYRIRATGAVIY